MNVITHTFVGLKCLTETKIQILCDHVHHTRFHIVEMGCQMVQLLLAHIVGPTMFVNLAPAIVLVNIGLAEYLGSPYIYKQICAADQNPEQAPIFKPSPG